MNKNREYRFACQANIVEEFDNVSADFASGDDSCKTCKDDFSDLIGPGRKVLTFPKAAAPAADAPMVEAKKRVS